jgi:hypothetical protein
MQPLSRVVPGRVRTDWGDGILSRHPNLAAKIGECIAEWTETEILLGVFLALLLHASERPVMAMYISLENRAAQLRIIDAAISSSLPQHHSDALLALMKVFIKPAMKYRDKLAHWSWGYSPDVPDGLLLTDTKHKLGGVLNAIRRQRRTAAANQDVPFDPTEMFVVKKDDLERFIKRIDRARLLLRKGMGSVWDNNSQEERDELLQQLSSERPIQEAMTRLAEARRKNQEVQQPSPQSGPNETA